MFPFTINGDVRIVGADTSLIRNTIIVRTVDSGLLGKGNSQMKNYELIHLLQQLPYNYDVVVDLDSRTTYDAGFLGCFSGENA